MPDVQGHCPACGAASLFLGEGGHVACWRTACVAPTAADQLLHGEGAALGASLRSASDVLVNLARQIPETLAKGLDRDNYALAPAPQCSCGLSTPLLSIDSAGAHWHQGGTTVPVPQEAFDRLVQVAMWVSRGQAMAHVPDPQISGSYPDAAARHALGALDDAGLLNTYQQTNEETDDA